MKKVSCVTFGILALSGLLGGACGSDDDDDGAGGSGGSAGAGTGGNAGSGISKGGSSGAGTGGAAGSGTSKGGSAGAGNASGESGVGGATGESGAAGADSGGQGGSAGGDSGGQSGAGGVAGAVSGGEGGLGGEANVGAGGAEPGGAGGAGGADSLPLPSCDEIPSLVLGDPGDFEVTVAGFEFCEPIPAQHTCDEKPFPQGTSPAITWTAGPEGTESYAVVFKDITIVATTPMSDPLHNRGFHYVIWDIPPSTLSLPAAMDGGHVSTDVPGARQWSNFNDYAFFGPCPNFDPEVPATNDDSYAFVVYALPFATATVPAPVAGISSVRTMDDYFRSIALSAVEYRGTSDAHASEIPDGVLPPTAKPPCPTEGEPPADCLAGP